MEPMAFLRKFFVELIVMAIIVGWAVAKFPDVMTRWIPWLCLIVFWHLSWEVFPKRWLPLLRWERTEWKRIVKLYIAVLLIGGTVSTLVIWSVNRGSAALERAEKAKEAPEVHGSNDNPCKLVATADSDMIDRFYLRGMQPRFDKKYSYSPQSQAFFYEWTLHIEANSILRNVEIIATNVDPIERSLIDGLMPQDFRTYPSEPHWKGGFPQPGQPPDFYTRAFDFSLIPANIPITLVIRRPVIVVDHRAYFPMNYAARDFSFRFESPCNVHSTNYDFTQQSDRITRHWRKLMSGGLHFEGQTKIPPVIQNPDDPRKPLKRNEVEDYLEVHCSDDECQKLKLQVWGRWGPRDDWFISPKPEGAKQQ
jgi:hypothetical protein